MTVDPTWPGATTRGTLWYPHINDAAPAVDPSVVPEMFGDTMLANGVVYPDAAVEPRRYRFRILNACNSRFLNLQLSVDDGSPDGITLTPALLCRQMRRATFPGNWNRRGLSQKPVVRIQHTVPDNPRRRGNRLCSSQ